MSHGAFVHEAREQREAAERERRQAGARTAERIEAARVWCERVAPDLCERHGTPIVVGAALTLRYAGRLSAESLRERLEGRP